MSIQKSYPRGGFSLRPAARDILDQHAKLKERNDLTRRIKAIEERLQGRQ